MRRIRLAFAQVDSRSVEGDECVRVEGGAYRVWLTGIGLFATRPCGHGAGSALASGICIPAPAVGWSASWRRAGILVLFALLFAVAPGLHAHAGNNFPGTTITGNSGSLNASNTTATGQTGEPTTYGGGSLNTMWYSWTAPGDGNLVLQTCGGTTNFDTTLQTFTGSAVNALTLVTTNDDSCGLQSSNTIAATAGTTYRIQVDGYGSATGNFTLSWTFTPTVVVPPAPAGSQVCSALTNAWTGNTATSGGIGVTISRSASGGASWSAATTNTMNTINAFSETAVQGRNSIVETFNWNEIRSLGGGTGDYTITFAKPVTNPVIHFDRVGGIIGTGQSNSSFWTLISGGTLFRLAGVGHFQTFSDNTFVRTIGVATAGGESSLNSATGTAAGSVMISGTHSSVTFRVGGDSPATGAAADAIEVVVCAPQADLSLAKIVNNATPTVGSNVTYTMTLNNNGPENAPGVQVTDLLPAGLTFVSATPSQGTYSSGTGLWDVGTVNNGASPTLQIVATVTGGGTITNTAQVTTSTYVDPDSNPGDGAGDDFASVNINVQGLPPVGAPQCTGIDLVTNGGFAVPAFPSPPSSNMATPGSVTGWTTTDTAIEIWESGFSGVPSHTGNQFAEINANIAGTLTNNSATVQPRAELSVHWAHRARIGTDTANLSISDNGGGLTNVGSFSSTTAAWNTFSARHVVSETGTSAALAFSAVSTGSGNISVGNFLDTVEICQTFLTIEKSLVSKADTDGSGTDSIGDIITYQFLVSNPAGNEHGVASVQIVDDKIGTFTAVPTAGDDGDNVLEPGETWTVTATYPITVTDLDATEVVNIAFVQGYTGANTIRSDDDTVTVPLTPEPALTVTKVATFGGGPTVANGTSDNVAVGTVLTYTYTVENTGNQTITSIGMSDIHAGFGTDPVPNPDTATLTDNAPTGDSTNATTGDSVWDALAPGDILTMTATYTVTQSDVDQLQ